MRRFFLILLLLILFSGFGFAAESVGTVKTIKGEAFAQRSEGQVSLSVGAEIFASDHLLTGSQSALGVILNDDTTLSLGPETEVLIRDYVFSPQESDFSMVLKILKGTFLYMSGGIGKLAPESIRLETPDSTISVRGTRVLIEVAP